MLRRGRLENSLKVKESSLRPKTNESQKIWENREKKVRISTKNRKIHLLWKEKRKRGLKSKLRKNFYEKSVASGMKEKKRAPLKKRISKKEEVQRTREGGR